MGSVEGSRSFAGRPSPVEPVHRARPRTPRDEHGSEAPSRARPDAQTVDPATGDAVPPPDVSAAFAAQRIAQEDAPAPPADTRTGNAAYERGTMRPLPRFDLVKPV